MFIGRQALLGSLYKTYWYKVKTPELLMKQTRWLELETSNIKRKEMIYDHPRLQAARPKGKEDRRLWELRIRNYDQHLAGFFCKNVLARRKIVIPLR